MVKQFVRRSVFAGVAVVLSAAAVGVAYAQSPDPSGTDRCPKGYACLTSSASDSSMSSNVVAVAQVMLLMAGMS